MWNDETNGLRARIAGLSNEELLQMVNLDHEQYRKEALDYARAEMERRGLKIEPVTFTDAPEEEDGAERAYSEPQTEAADSEYFEPDMESEREVMSDSVVEFKVFRGALVSWDELFSEAATFATDIGSLNLIGISHSISGSEGVVTVWYWS